MTLAFVAIAARTVPHRSSWHQSWARQGACRPAQPQPMTIPAWRQMLVWLHARQWGDPVVAAMMDGQLMGGMGDVRGHEREDGMEGGMEGGGWAWLGNRTFRASCLKPLILCMIPVSVQHRGAHLLQIQLFALNPANTLPVPEASQALPDPR